jgi:hypothetical protein
MVMNLNTNRFSFTIGIVLALTTISACSKLCNAGYEGSRCNELTVTKFEGNWSAVDTPGNLVYIDTISKGGTINDIMLSVSFAGHHFNHAVIASVLDSVITIPYQQPDADSNFVQGIGTLSPGNNHILFNYQLIVVADTLQYKANYTGSWTRIN